MMGISKKKIASKCEKSIINTGNMTNSFWTHQIYTTQIWKRL